MANPPNALQQVLEDFDFADRQERIQLLIEYADRFAEVPPDVATRPFPEEHHVTRCESQAYVWATPNADGTLKFHFAVENPQGISAKAWAVMMDETLSGQPLEQVLAVPGDAVFRAFGKEISMGKGEGLLGMLSLVQAFARRHLAAAGAAT